MYRIELKYKNQLLQTKNVGSWHDLAREKFAAVRRAIEPLQGRDLELTLITPRGEIELQYKTEENQQ